MEVNENVTLTPLELIILNGMVTGQRIALQDVHDDTAHQEVLLRLHMKLTRALLRTVERVQKTVKEVPDGGKPV